MGFLSKIWKGIKTGVKSIAKSVKSAVKSVGKFMNKIGVVGQIGLMFLMPGIGAMLSKGIGLLAGASNPLLAGVGKVLQTAGKFASTAGNAFRTVTDGVMGFVSNVGKGFVNQTASMLGAQTPLIGNAPLTVGEGFQKWMTGVHDSVMNIPSPFRDAAQAVNTNVSQGFESSFDPETYTKFTPDQKDFRFYEVPAPQLQAIQNAETVGNGGFVQSFKNTVKEMPTTLMNKGAEALTSAVVTKGMQAAGLSTEPTYNNISNTTVVPKFDSTPISNVYEQNGIGYGALPDNRIQFLAAQQIPDMDFGFNSFNQFRRLGIA